MEVSKRRLLSKPKPECIQEKTMKSVHRVVKERRLFLNRICAQGETESPRKLGLKRRTESIQNKPLNSVNRVPKKKRLTGIFQSPASAQEKGERKLGLTIKRDCVQKLETSIDGAVKKGRLTQSRNQQRKKISTEISLEKREAKEKGRLLHDWRKIIIDRERQKQREAARLALEQVKNTCGFQDNMDSMRDFEKLVGCSSTFYIFSRDPKYCYG